MILLKSEKRTSEDIAADLGCCEVVVNNWLVRFQKEGIKDLARATADFEWAKSGEGSEGGVGNKETSELGQNGGCPP